MINQEGAWALPSPSFLILKQTNGLRFNFKGRAVPCKDVVGGIRAVYFVDFGDLGTVTLTNDEVTDISRNFLCVPIRGKRK
jgi:hypothetical protein